MTGFYLDISTDKSHLDDVLASLEDKLNPVGLSMFLSLIVDPFLRNRIEQRFQSEGDDVTGRWHPLAIATQQIRASYGFPPDHPINIRTNKMHAWLVGTQSDIQPNGMGATLTHPPPGASGVLMKKLATAQGGSTNPPTSPRPVIGMNENDLMFITSSLVAWLAQDMI